MFVDVHRLNEIQLGNGVEQRDLLGELSPGGGWRQASAVGGGGDGAAGRDDEDALHVFFSRLQGVSAPAILRHVPRPRSCATGAP